MNITDPVVIIRNGVGKQLSIFDIVKGKREGKQYLAPKIELETIKEDLEWVGSATVMNILQKSVKIAFQEIWFDCINADGSFNDALFLKKSEEFTSSALKLAEIDAQLDEAQATQGQLIATASTDADGLFTNPAEIAAIKENSRNIMALRAMREARSNRGKTDEVTDPSVPAVAKAA